jgi:hypothetical protein
MKKLSLLLGLGALLGALPAQAQAGNASDVTGPITTGGDIVGGIFAPAPAPAGGSTATGVAGGMAAAAPAVSAALSTGSLTATTPSGQTVAIPATTQAALLAVLTGADAPADFAAALGASGAPAAGQLMQALGGLLSAPAQLPQAVALFNALVQDASPAFLANPPAEFLAVHATLAHFTAAGQPAR